MEYINNIIDRYNIKLYKTIHSCDEPYIEQYFSKIKFKSFEESGTGMSFSRKNAIYKSVFPTNYTGMVIINPVNVISLCSHHMLPVEYKVIFGYLPFS